MLEAVLYGSIPRHDYTPGCSDLDLFLVVEHEVFDPKPIESLVAACLETAGIRVRGVDIAWCTLGEVYSSGCRYKFLTIYRGDFEDHSVLLYGTSLHEYQDPSWDPHDRCTHLKRLSRRREMRKIVAGEAVKLMLALGGYEGPWDKESILREASRRLSPCAVEVWKAYLECREPREECVEEVLGALSSTCP